MSDDMFYAVFIEARKEKSRVQWVAFPPAVASQEIPSIVSGKTAFMKRRLDGEKSSRSTWKFYSSNEVYPDSEVTIPNQLKQFESIGWEILEPVVAAMYPDDYRLVWTFSGFGGHTWSPKTPYKLLRAVERVTKKRGYRLTGRLES